MVPQKPMNFWKSSKEGGGVIFNPKIDKADDGTQFSCIYFCKSGQNKKNSDNNKDFYCLHSFCVSPVTLRGGKLRIKLNKQTDRCKNCSFFVTDIQKNDF